MLYAFIAGNKQLAKPELRESGALCPHCRVPVVAKCGEIKIAHWAHPASLSCEHESETQWHLDWKSRFPAECVEISVGSNRADVLIGDWAFEFQHSSITPAEIRERQQAYGKIAWVFDCGNYAHNLRLRQRDGYVSFRWRWPKRSLEAIDLQNSKLFFDLGDDGNVLIWNRGELITIPSRLFEVRKIHWDGQVAGWGLLFGLRDFLDWMRERIEHERCRHLQAHQVRFRCALAR